MSSKFKVLILVSCLLFAAAAVADAEPFWAFHTGHVSKYTRAKWDGTSWPVTMTVKNAVAPGGSCTSAQYYEVDEWNYENTGETETIQLGVNDTSGFRCVGGTEYKFFQTGPEGTGWDHPAEGGGTMKYQVVAQYNGGNNYAIRSYKLDVDGVTTNPPNFSHFQRGFGLIKEVDRWVPDNAPWTQAKHGNRGLTMYAVWPSGIYVYDYEGTKEWKKVHSSVPSDIVAAGPILYAVWPSGIYLWDGNVWHRIHTAVPSKMVAVSNRIYCSWPSGLYMWTNVTNTWTKVHSTVPSNMFASRLMFYATFSVGVFQHDGTAWSKIHSAIPTKMITPP
ncbi:MAG: hypothetical protein PHU49_01740 [Syntrophorhabdaceae bacterium]|nr:hypothetical protein [Syntrophorhabdaceae bacterium]